MTTSIRSLVMAKSSTGWSIVLAVTTVLVFSALSTQSAGAQSFNCAEAHSAVESEICGSATLAALDAEYGAKYRAVTDSFRDDNPGQFAEVRDRARAFLQQRNQCDASAECIADAYRGVIQYLSAFPAAAIAGTPGSVTSPQSTEQQPATGEPQPLTGSDQGDQSGSTDENSGATTQSTPTPDTGQGGSSVAPDATGTETQVPPTSSGQPNNAPAKPSAPTNTAPQAAAPTSAGQTRSSEGGTANSPIAMIANLPAIYQYAIVGGLILGLAVLVGIVFWIGQATAHVPTPTAGAAANTADATADANPTQKVEAPKREPATVNGSGSDVQPKYKVQTAPYRDGSGTSLVVESEIRLLLVSLWMGPLAIGEFCVIFFGIELVTRGNAPPGTFMFTVIAVALSVYYLLLRPKKTTISVTPTHIIVDNKRRYSRDHVGGFSIWDSSGAELWAALSTGQSLDRLRTSLFAYAADTQGPTTADKAVLMRYGTEWIGIAPNLSDHTAELVVSSITEAMEKY